MLLYSWPVRAMIRFFYNLFFPFGLLFFLPGLVVKMVRRGNYRHKFGQRFGIYSFEVQERLVSRNWTWIHAVSVGEVMVALKLAAELRKSDPQIHIALTTSTTTGFALANKQAPRWMEVLYGPLDFWPVIRRAFHFIQPEQIILIEAEVWPNVAAIAHARDVPLALVNARLSARSEKRFRFFKFAVAPMFRRLNLVCVPELEDIIRWEGLGVAPNRIRQTGNIKYDLEGSNLDAEFARKTLNTSGINSSRPVMFGGSTHAGEEVILAKIFLALRQEFPSLLLVIAPRHAERAGAIRERLESLSIRVACRSELESSAASVIDCLLLDSTGELRNWYSIATVTFVGKSLTVHGGQNPVEPLSAENAVLFGPYMENFLSLSHSLVRQQAAIQVADPSDLQREFARLLRDREAREKLVANAGKVLAAHRGATRRTTELVLKLHRERRTAATPGGK